MVLNKVPVANFFKFQGLFKRARGKSKMFVGFLLLKTLSRNKIGRNERNKLAGKEQNRKVSNWLETPET